MFRREYKTIKKSGLFDEKYYLKTYEDVCKADIDPIKHYIKNGWKEGRNPSEKFSTNDYIQQNNISLNSKYSPLFHQIKSLSNKQKATNSEYNIIKKSNLFDEIYYLQTYPDVKNANIEAVKHFMEFGWKEGRNPSNRFDTNFYLETYKDVKEANINPLIHYIKYGETENRIPIQRIDTNFQKVFKIIKHVKNNPQLIKRAISEIKLHGLKKTIKKICQKVDPVVNNLTLPVFKYSYVENFDLEKIYEDIIQMKYKPFFSIVMPVYNVSPKWLNLALKSIEDQLYDNWELCIVDDCSTNLETINYLKAIKNDKVKIKFLTKNLNISGATNEAINNVLGDYIVFMDNDDEITKDALYELAKAINLYNNPDMIYSDEDKIDINGVTSDPFFKPDWSPDTFMSIMYICHLTCYKKAIIDKLNGLRVGYEGAQDYDLGLRFMEISSNVVHIPKVLYHWRMLETSVAYNMSSKGYAVESLKKAKIDALNRRKLIGKLIEVDKFSGQYIVSYENQNNPRISIIIPTKDKFEVLKTCIDSIYNKTSYKNYEIVIVNNQSIEKETFEYFESLKSKENLKIIDFNESFNFSKMNNIGVQKSEGEYLLFLNNDTEIVSSNWLDEMVGYASLEHVGAVGVRLHFPQTKNIQHCGIINLNDGPGHAFYNFSSEKIYSFGRNVLPYNYIAVTAACMMIERKKFLEVNMYDESFPIAYNDVDLCFKLHNNNYFNVSLNHLYLIHYESISRGIDHENSEKLKRLEKERKRLYQKHPHLYYKDPFYNINLHPNSIDFKYEF